MQKEDRNWVLDRVARKSFPKKVQTVLKKVR